MTHRSDSELIHLSALKQAELIRRGELSSHHLTEIYLARIKRYNEALNAFVSVQERRARRAAKRADKLRREIPEDQLPIFHGVPIGIKDLVPTQWSATRLGSRAYRHFISPFDAPVVSRLKEGGFISLGKLATSEFGAMPVTEPEIHPPTRNPWNIDFSSGGSSGGSSAAVAAHLLPIAQGSDGGGSVRIPAALTHLYGFKPSLSLLGNLHGAYNLLGISVMGPLAHTVEDAAALLDVMAGRPMQEAGPDSCLAATRHSPKSLKVRLLVDAPLGGLDSEMLGRLRAFAELMRSLGHVVEEGRSPQIELEEFLPIWRFAISSVRTLSDRYVQPVTRWLRQEERQVSFERAESIRQKLARRITDSFAGADILLSATTPITAPRIGAFDHSRDPEEVFYEAARLGSLTAGFNITQGPAASLPMGVTQGGLPFGIQIGARPGQDHMLLALSRQIERSAPWLERRAPHYS